MTLKRRRDTRAVTAPLPAWFFVLTALLLASCGSDQLEGRVVLSGSSTLASLATTAVDQWKALHPRVEGRVEPIGSDSGLERLLRYGDADFALVSRPLTDADQAGARAAQKDLVILPLAWDAVCLVVPASNTWARSLTRDQATRAFTTARLWSDLDPAWPSQPIHRFALGPNSGTADVFALSLLGGNKGRIFAAAEVQASEDDRILARGVAEVDGALGYLGWTTFRESDKNLRVLALDGVTPSPATILDRTYGLPRQLWLVGTSQSMASAPALSLVRFLYEHYPALAARTGLIPLSETERNAVDQILSQ